MSGINRESLGEYGVLRELLADSFGLKLSADSSGHEQTVQARMQALGLGSLAKYQAYLESADGGEELFALAGEVIVGRSDFNDPHLMAICEQFLRPILRGRLTNRPEGSKPSLSIWSVGCGNGAEIYSVLMQMAKLTQLGGWQLQVLGTDFSSESITRARRGVYGKNELKGIGQEDLGNFFSTSFGESGKQDGWAIARTLSSVCRFEQHNILAPEMPGNSSDGFNLILCRGVLEHLSKTGREEVLSKLARYLSPDGLLVVGADQARLFDHSLLEGEVEKFESVFRRRTGRLKPIPSAPRARQGQNERTGLRRKLQSVFLSGSTRRPAARRKRPVKVVSIRATAGELVRRAWQLTEDFQFPQALLTSRKARELDASNVEALYLNGVAARRLDRLGEAIEVLELACRLDETLVMAHFLLGHIYQEIHKPALAQQHYRAVLQILECKAADEPILFNEGMSEDVLRDLCVTGEEALIEMGVGEK